MPHAWIILLPHESLIPIACLQGKASTAWGYIQESVRVNTYQSLFVSASAVYILRIKASEVRFPSSQVSHHPPISAFYAENVSKRISFCGHIWTKSKFLGLSVCVYNIGQGCVSVLDHDEEYIVNFPSGYGRSVGGGHMKECTTGLFITMIF